MSSASRTPMITYCVPAHEVQPLPDFEEEHYFCPQLVYPSAYPSASAEYSVPSAASAEFSYPTDDPDFCDIIADLANGECYDFSWGPSAVALPVDECENHSTVAAVSISLPEGYVTPYDAKGIQIVHASAVKALAEHESEEDLKLKYMDYEELAGFHEAEDMAVLKKKKKVDQKLRRQHAVLRLKEKRKLKKYKLVAKASDVAVTSRPAPQHVLPVKTESSSGVIAATTAVVTTITARQAAAAHRERVKGKFKHNKTRWVGVTEFLRRTHLHSADGDGDGTGGKAGGWEDGNT